ncbi:MAG: IMPACT family protein [Plesiomonas sp.]|uniref:IMPACT family protein n=1 Tax=Plesiomonas sp. TaxID=2486279 RepID=UPI003F3EA59D
MAHYPIPAQTAVFEEEIKKSRFITLLAHTAGVDAAKYFVSQVKAEHPQARHHCWAFVAGNPHDSQQLGFSDDGEPAGTAGKPILNCLLGSGIGEITAVVVRYYGGVKLGTGGLVRAYGNGTQQALKILIKKEKVERQYYRVECDYALLSTIENILSDYQGEKIESTFAEYVTLILALPSENAATVAAILNDRSRGGAIFQAWPR